MTRSDSSVPRRRGWLSVFARGHFLLFDKTSPPRYDAWTGSRLLLIAVGIEALRIVLVKWLYPAVPLLILVVLLLVFSLLLVRLVAPLKQIGLYRWTEWTPIEKSYFVQLL